MRTLWFVILCVILVAGPVGAATLGDEQIGFSADRLLVIDGRTYRGKIWAMPGRERHEQAISGFRPVFLLRADNPLGEIVLPQLKTIVEFKLPAELRIFATPALKKHPVGRETVNGIATTRYSIDESVPEGHATGALWLSRDGIPMRLAGSFTKENGKVSTIRWELSHIRIGPQPASLFEAPLGFSRLPPEAIAPLLGVKLKAAAR
ncbi:MAG TPA: hypothetical protein VGS13_11665 [Stellaceae bacterium]|nr:hypothetical protein [Stellaceae bacterium]